MSIWTSIPEGAQPIEAGTGIPGDDKLKVDVAVAPSWNDRTRIAAWNNETGIEILVAPADLEELISRLQQALMLERAAAAELTRKPIDELTAGEIEEVVAAAGCTMVPDTTPLRAVDIERLYDTSQAPLAPPRSLSGVEDCVFPLEQLRAADEAMTGAHRAEGNA